MDDEMLITLVQNYEELYNLKHSQYANQQRRDNIWEEIGNIMKFSGKTCRERWARIRENHRKALNLRKTKSGQASKKIKTPKFDKELTFLVTYLFDEETRHSNISSPSSQAISDGDESEHNEEDCSHPVLRDTSPPPMSCASSSRSSTSTPFTERKKRKFGIQPAPSAAAVLQDYLQTRKSQSLNNATKRDENALTKFFLSMAETVNGFPLRDQVEIKSKLFKMVNDVEVRMLLGKTNAGGPQSSQQVHVLQPPAQQDLQLTSTAASSFQQGPYQSSYYDLDYHRSYGSDQ